jgi:ABC-type branched-subunit amino acid transport system permease subunit
MDRREKEKRQMKIIGKNPTKLKLWLAFAASVILSAAGAAHGATLTFTNTIDSGTGSFDRP